MIDTFEKFLEYEKILIESPQLIPTHQQYPFENWAENPNIGNSILNSEDVIFEQLFIFNNIKLNIMRHNLDKMITYYLISPSTKNIMGYVRLKKEKELYFTNGLWQYHPLTGFIRTFLTNYLLPKYKLLISDNLMTQKGADFWKKIIQYGFDKNYEVGIYYFDENKFEKILDFHNIESLWQGKDSQNKRIYIKEK